jgi:hypothetical protein
MTRCLGLLRRPLGLLLALALRVLARSWRLRVHGAELMDEVREGRPLVLAFFHGEQVPMVALHRDLPVASMVSWSADGELLASVITHLGYLPVRGSSSRGGRRAFLECVRCLLTGERSPALAVDGPRGPPHVPHRGVVALAASTARPIVYGRVRASLAWTFASWDRLFVPLPFSRVELRYGWMPPPEPEPEAIETARGELGRRMLALQD